MKILYLQWKDAVGDSAQWYTAEETANLSTLDAAGLLVQENKETLTLALLHKSRDEELYRGVITIPVKSIIKRKEFKV